MFQYTETSTAFKNRGKSALLRRPHSERPAMRLSDHTDYGLRLLLLLGASRPARINASQMARTYGISYTHVQKVVQSLEAAGYVETFRGRGGGVILAREPSEITIGAVVRALEPNMHIVRCLAPGDSGCILAQGCALTNAIAMAGAAFLSALDTVTLDEMIRGSPHLAPLSATF